MKLFLPDNYEVRAVPEYYDDSENTDNWQNEVYCLAKQLAVKSNIKEVFDYGCGSGFKLRKHFLKSNFYSCGIDLPPTVEFLRKNYPTSAWLNVDEFDFDALSRDSMLICSDVIEHMEEPLLFMQRLAGSNVGVVVLSTPARELLIETGQTRTLGPPTNTSHVCEWSCLEFHDLVSQFFNVSEHIISNVKQATQFLIAYPKNISTGEITKVLS